MSIEDLKAYPYSDILPPTSLGLLQQGHNFLIVPLPMSLWGPITFKLAYIVSKNKVEGQKQLLKVVSELYIIHMHTNAHIHIQMNKYE